MAAVFTASHLKMSPDLILDALSEAAPAGELRPEAAFGLDVSLAWAAHQVVDGLIDDPSPM